MAAKNYTEILELVNAGNQMGLSNTIKRDYGIPLDFTSVQASYDDAVVYAATNTKAYVGQPLSVGGKLYIINDVAAEAKHKVGEVEYDNYLVEVGSATEGDGVTIDLEEGVLTLHGFESALTGYLPRKAEDGSLEWVPISAVVQGDGNKVTTLTSEDGSVTITKKTDTDESLVYDLSVVHPDAPEYAIAADERAEGATSTTYHLTKDGENVDVAIVVPDAYNDTALAGRVSDVETAVNTTIPGMIDTKLADYTKTEDLPTDLGDFSNEAGYAKTADVNAELDKKANKSDYDQTVLDLDALEARVEAFLDNTGAATEAIDTLQELLTYIEEHDDVELASMLASIQALENKLVLGTHEVDGETKEYATVKAYVEAVIEALNVAQYAKASDLADAVGRVAVLEAKPFDTYATKTEVNEARTGAVADVAAVGYALATDVERDYATKQELTDHSNTINTTLNDYAKTADVEADLAKKIETGSIVHTSETNATEGVIVDGTKLNIVVDTYTKQEVRDYVADVIEDMTGGESAADVLLALNNHIATYEEKVGQIDEKDNAQDAAIATADGKGAQGIADAAAAKSVADEAKAQAETNKTDIGTILGRLSNVETASGTNTTNIGVIQGQINALIGEDTAINETLGTIAGQITALQGEDATIKGALATKANTADVYTKAEIELYSKSEINDLLANLDQTELEQGIADNKAAIEAIYKVDGETKSGVLVTEIARVEQANADAIAALTNGAIKDNADAITALDATLKAALENDGEGLDSIKELALWIEDHESDILPILSGFGGTDEPANIKTYVDESIAAIPVYDLPAATAGALGGVKLSDEIGLDADQKLKIQKVSTDTLVNGVEEFIIYGGSATVAETPAE